MATWRRWSWSGLGILALAAGCAGPGKEAGFVGLFDGKTLEGWSAYTEAGEPVSPAECSFSVQDGTLHCSGHGKDYWIARSEKFRDCVLRLEYKITSGTNSGVFLRAPRTARPAFEGYEVQLLDDIGKEADTHISGAIYDVIAPARNASRPVGEWNEMEITHNGSHVTVILNGDKIIDTDFAAMTQPIGKFDFSYAKMPREGYIGFQNHGGQLWLRNIRVKRL